jgi:hypothetical protein
MAIYKTYCTKCGKNAHGGAFCHAHHLEARADLKRRRALPPGRPEIPGDPKTIYQKPEEPKKG